MATSKSKKKAKKKKAKKTSRTQATKKKVTKKKSKNLTKSKSAKRQTKKTAKAKVSKKKTTRRAGAKKTTAKKNQTKKAVTQKTAVKKAKKASKPGPLPKKSQAVVQKYSTKSLSRLFKPLDNRLVVEVKGASDRTPGGLYIPDTVTAERPHAGYVLAVGRGHLSKKGKLKPMDVKVGDEVVFATYAGTEAMVDGHPVLILREEDILGVLA